LKDIFEENTPSLPLLAIKKLEELNSDEYELIYNHANSYFPSDRRLGYQPLLVYTGVELVNMQSGSKISNQDFVDSLVSILGEEKRLEFAKILPDCTNYWLGRKWLDRIDKGIYVRTSISLAKYPTLDLSHDNSPE